LRRGTVADLEGLLSLEARCFGENEGVFHRRQLRHLLRSPQAVWFIEGEYEAAACLLLASNGKSRWGRLYSLSVAPAYRHRGAARLLLEASFDYLKGLGITLCRAEVKSDNVAARGLYASMGFTEGALLAHYYGIGEHGIKLSRRL